MYKTPLFWQIFSLLVVVALFHLTSTYFYWYWGMFWSHMVSHFLSGLLVALSGYIKHVPGRGSAFLIALFASALVGLLWEVFQLESSITFFASPTYFFDTGAAFLMDVAGGLIGYAYFSYKGFPRV